MFAQLLLDQFSLGGRHRSIAERTGAVHTVRVRFVRAGHLKRICDRVRAQSRPVRHRDGRHRQRVYCRRRIHRIQRRKRNWSCGNRRLRMTGRCQQYWSIAHHGRLVHLRTSAEQFLVSFKRSGQKRKCRKWQRIDAAKRGKWSEPVQRAHQSGTSERLRVAADRNAKTGRIIECSQRTVIQWTESVWFIFSYEQTNK